MTGVRPDGFAGLTPRRKPAPPAPGARPEAADKLPLGIDNNNPGNIEKNDIPWNGKLAPEQMTEAQRQGRFEVFDSEVNGIRAMVKNLHTYEKKYGLRKIEGIVNRWAKPKENDTEAYIRSMVQHSGFARDEVLDLHDADTMRRFVQAMIRHENGIQPYGRGILDEAMRKAGMRVE